MLKRYSANNSEQTNIIVLKLPVGSTVSMTLFTATGNSSSSTPDKIAQPKSIENNFLYGL